MIGSINKAGEFIVNRKDGLSNLQCPYAHKPCGTWCPHFSEPIRQRNKKQGDRLETLIHICNDRYWKFTDFTDSRESARL